MSTTIPGGSVPAATLPFGVGRLYCDYDFTASSEAIETPAGYFRLWRTWSATFQKNRQELILRDLRDKTERLASGLRLLDIPDRENMADFRVAISSAPGKFQGLALDGLRLALHQFQVERLAQAQTSTSAKLTRTGIPAPGSVEYLYDSDVQGLVGTFSFDLNVNDQVTSVEIKHVRTGPRADNNEDLFSKIAREVEAADSRLQAAVLTSTGWDENSLVVEKAALQISSRTTGRGVLFSLSDTTGDLVKRLGLDRTAPTGSFSRIQYDRTDRQASGRQVVLEDGRLLVDLLQPSGPYETLTIEEGLQALVRQTGDLLGDFNDYVYFLQRNRRDIKKVILNDITRELYDNRSGLRDIGLALLSYGGLGLTDGYAQSLLGRPEKVREVLTSENGVFTAITDILENLLSRNLGDFARPVQSVSRIYHNTFKPVQALGRGICLSQTI